MQFDFDQFPTKDIRKSQKIQDILDRLQKSSDHSKRNKDQQINFSNFGPIDQNQPGQKSFTSQMFNKPKEQSVRESNQRPQIEYEQGSSRDIQQISYLYSENQSFRFDRSMSFEQQNKDNSRFDRLKSLLSKAKSNNLDAFYKNLEQAANQKNQGNLIFQNKNQFKEYTRNMRAQKRDQQAKFQIVMEQKKANQKVKTKGMTANLFGEQAFKKKEAEGFMMLPPEYSQQKYQEEEDVDIDFFKSSNQPKQVDPNGEDQYRQQKRQTYMKEAVDFFDSDGAPVSQGKIDRKKPLESIREEKYSMLDASLQEKKFQQLINNYSNMKGNYNSLMQQLKQTSNSQYQLMQEMQKIKYEYNSQQSKQKQSRLSSEDEKKIKKEEREKIKQVKQQQLATIKHQIQQIKTTSDSKDFAYVKINQKIQQLEQLVRVALDQMQQQKQQHNFTPKVINYYNQPQSQQNQRTPSNQQEEFSDHANLSQQTSSMYQAQNNQQEVPNEKQFASTGGVKPQKQIPSAIKKERPASKHHSKMTSKIQSYQGSVRRQGQQRNVPYGERNVQKETLNFVDEFSSPLQLDLSVDFNNQNNVSSSSQEMYQIPFNPADNALEYLPLKLDQTQTKNLRNILTQKSSILFESFQFLITVRYTMQDDDIYPVIGSLRLANKCAIDLLDVFVIVYGPQGQNVEVSPSKIFQQRLKYNSNLFFQVRLDKNCIKDNGFNVQVCYKTDSITKKKINFKALLPMVQMIRPEFCYEENFVDTWDSLRNQIYIRPKKLNFKHIRNHEDLKLILPFIHISQQDPNTFSYGLMFKYPKSEMMFMLKVSCYINGKASVHLRSDKNGDQPLKEELLNILNFLFLK